MIRAGVMWVVLAGSAGADGLPALFDVRGVAAGDVLNIRAEPSANAPIIGQIARNAAGVEVVAASGDGKWGLVNVGDGQGHVALRFLARQPGPDWFELQTAMVCSGTEPFWSLTYDPAQSVASFATPDADTAFEVTNRWPRTEYQPVAGLGLGAQSFVFLQAQSCNDGMSDRAFGLTANLFLSGDAGPFTLSGCCTLQP